MKSTFIVVPCYNEAKRLQGGPFLAFAERRSAKILFVNDGSTDETAERLEQLYAENPESFHVLSLAENRGKAEAVRRGMLEAIAQGACVAAYFDADLSTPTEDLERLLDRLDEGGAKVVLGSRVKLLGRDIRRSELRHYAGRVFATCAAMVLRLGVYDTQCGAKVFRVGPELEDALATPFCSRWAFDVELLGRLLTGPQALSHRDLFEQPLRHWLDVPGSKLTLKAMIRAAADLIVIAWHLRRRRRAAFALTSSISESDPMPASISSRRSL